MPKNDDSLKESEVATPETDLNLSDDEPEDVITASTDEIGHSIASFFRLTVGIQNL